MKTNVMSLGKIFSRDELKKIRGGASYGDNPNCAGDTGTSTWYCCTTSGAQLIGTTTCNDASSKCSGGMITNDKSRCN